MRHELLTPKQISPADVSTSAMTSSQPIPLLAKEVAGVDAK